MSRCPDGQDLSIRIVFSIADVEDSGMDLAEEEGEEGEDAAESTSNGIRTAIIIAKEGKGSVTIDAVADGASPGRTRQHALDC